MMMHGDEATLKKQKKKKDEATNGHQNPFDEHIVGLQYTESHTV